MHARLVLAVLVCGCFLLSTSAASALHSSSSTPAYCDPRSAAAGCLNAANKACKQLGETTMDGNNQNLIACLDDGSGTNTNVWKPMSPNITFMCPAGQVLVGITDGKPTCSLAQFGGIFNTNMDGSCRYANPLTGVCSCPSGFVAHSFGEWASPDCGIGAYADGWRTENCGYAQFVCM
ncbi:MAG: hypothetical protein PHY92_09295 [Alphaproteobacteria bacterium]|nr:hypothetical protein [Alphaproteobacteria bacterium]